MHKKDYKRKPSIFNMQNQKGQVAIFIMLALVIVAVIIVILLKPKSIIPSTNEFSPSSFLKSCLESDLKSNIELLSKNGGYKEEGELKYQGDKIKYLCYTAEYYKTCVIQQPLLKEHFEKELSISLSSKAQQCIQNLKKEYEGKGYQVTSGKTDLSVSINPEETNLILNSPLTIKKENTQSFRQFEIKEKSQMYELLMTAVSILDYESSLGDSETTLYMKYYPNLKIEKVKLSDGSKVYTLTNVITKESFRFASRSLSWPPGYGL